MNAEGSEPVVVTLDDQVDEVVDRASWEALAIAVLVEEGFGRNVELNLTFIGPDEMTELNESHMGKVGPTDVLSFPLEEDALNNADPTPPDQPRLLGDVLICPRVVHAQAPDRTTEEMALMVVHGVLHILGMDHQQADEAAVMRAAEVRHLERWRERASAP